MKKTIIVTGGGTGGHLIPAMGICETILDLNHKPILITDKRCKSYLPEKLDYEAIIIDIIKFSGLFSFFYFIYSFFKSLTAVMKIILREKVSLVIACGGYSSLPVIIASIILRKKLIIHEQNAYVGKANYIFSYFSYRLFLTFIHTINLPLINNKKIVWTGIPCLKIHEKVKVKNSIPLDKLTILITGGSQGAAFFDKTIPEIISLLVNKIGNRKLKIIQQVRTDDDIEKIQNLYNKLEIEHELKKFFHDINEKYNEANLFIGRSGASTVNDIINYQLPAIFIPYPYAKSNHQYLNAKNLENFKCSWILNQNEAHSNAFLKLIQKIISDKNLYKDSVSVLGKLKVETKKIISEEIQKIIDKTS